MGNSIKRKGKDGMDAKEVLKSIGGIRKARAFAKGLSKKYGMDVAIERHTNDNDPDDQFGDFLNMVFEYAGGDYPLFSKALGEAESWFRRLGHHLRHECYGDGEKGIVASYRVI